MQRQETILAQKAAPKEPESQIWQFLQGHPKPAFSEKVQRGDQEKFFKNHQKVALVLKAQKDTGANGIIL